MSADAAIGGSPTPRAQPFYCPYCGEQEIRPAAAGGFHCGLCDRRFELAFRGLGDPVPTEEVDR